MRFSALRSNLVDALIPAVAAVSRRPSLTVLSHVRLSTDDGEVTIAGTDLEHGVVTRCPVKVEEEGAITVSAVDLLRIVRAAPKDALVTISTDATSVVVNAGGTYTLRGLDAEEFPIIPSPGALTFQIVAHELRRLLVETIPCAATGDSRPILAGISIEVRGSGEEPGTTITAAAADNYRIAAATGETIGPALASFVLPATIAKSLVALLRGPEVVSVFVTNPAQAIVTFGDKHGREVVFATRLIDGQFPNWQQVIPGSFGTTAIVERSALVATMAQAAKMADAGVAVLHFEADGLRVTAKRDGLPSFDAMIPATVTGEPLSIGSNAGQWAALAPLTDDLVRIRASSVESPAMSPLTVDVPDIPAPGNYTYVVMPVRLKES